MHTRTSWYTRQSPPICSSTWWISVGELVRGGHVFVVLWCLRRTVINIDTRFRRRRYHHVVMDLQSHVGFSTPSVRMTLPSATSPPRPRDRATSGPNGSARCHRRPFGRQGHGHICAYSSFFRRSTTGMHLFPSGRSRSPTRNRSFRVSAESIGPCKYVFIPVFP